MAFSVHIPDEILHRILSRLPTKSIFECRLVSTHCNDLITEPYFMKSRRMILLNVNPLRIVNKNTPTLSIVKNRFHTKTSFASPNGYDPTEAFGFSYGGLKIVAFRRCDESYVCEVFSIKDGCWRMSYRLVTQRPISKLENDVGVFLDGSYLGVATTRRSWPLMLMRLGFQRSICRPLIVDRYGRLIWVC